MYGVSGIDTVQGSSRVKGSASDVRHLFGEPKTRSGFIPDLNQRPKPPFLPNNDQPNTNPSRQHR